MLINIIKIRIPNWSKMWLNKDNCWSIPINKYQFCSIKISADQCQSVPIIAGLINDQHWSALIHIDRHWSTLIFIELNWSLLIRIDQHWSFYWSTSGSIIIPEFWFLLIRIGIDPACPKICLRDPMVVTITWEQSCMYLVSGDACRLARQTTDTRTATTVSLIL